MGKILLLLVVLVAAWLLPANLPDLKPRTEAEAVLTAPVQPRSFEVTVEVMGELDAAKARTISSEVAGQATIIYLVEDGSHVERGDVLVRLDPTKAEANVRELEGELRLAEVEMDIQARSVEWEKNQAERSVKAAEFSLKAAGLALTKLEKGEGPLQLSRLEEVVYEARDRFEANKGYAAELKALGQQGYTNQAELIQAQKRLRDTEQAYDNARKQLDSYRNYVLPLMLEQARSRVAQEEMNLENTRKGAELSVQKAEAANRKATKRYETLVDSLLVAKAELERTVLRAPFAGMVVCRVQTFGQETRKPRVGDKVWQGQPIVYLPDVSALVVKLRIREIDLHKIRVGRPAVVRVDALPEAGLTGRVVSIGALAEADRQKTGLGKYFDALVSLDQSGEELRPGMTARVSIDCGRVEQALAVPVQAVFVGDGQAFVYVDTKASFEKRQVRLGVQNEVWAEVTTGLTRGEAVALTRPAETGVRGVRPLPPGSG